MGVNFKKLVPKEPTSLDSFANKIVAIDAYNALYQFLSTIRGINGLQLTDSHGHVTSHISGLFYRNINYLSKGILPVYIFDGKSPSLKSAEVARRRQIKKDATVKYERAISEGNTADAKKYAQQTTTLNDYMISDAKTLLGSFGIPYVDAKGEGEATAAHLTRTGKVFATASQDYDSILFGSTRLVRNFTTSGRRKIPNRNSYIDLVPEMIYFEKTLESLKLTHEELVDVAILIGTDFNPNGFKRIGPATAIKMIREHSRLEDIPAIQEQLDMIDYSQIRDIFLKPDVSQVDDIEFGDVNNDDIIQFMAQKHDFSADKINASLGRLEKALEKKNQTLENWF